MVPQMKRKLTQTALIKSIEKRAFCLEDPRAANRHYSLKDVFMTSFWMCFLNADSLSSYYEDLQKAKGNVKKLLGVREVPCRNQMCNVLDQIPLNQLSLVFDDILKRMDRSGVLNDFKHSRFGYLMALDGTQISNSEKISCENCCQKHHEDGRVQYCHSVLNAMLIHPSQNVALPVGGEFIQRQDGRKKQDCERNAAKRWLNAFSKQHKIMNMTILADDLHCNQPFIEALESKGYNYIMTCKEGSHKYLYEWIEAQHQGGDLQTLTLTKYEGNRKRIYQYEYVNGIDIREHDALKGNYVKLTIKDALGGRNLGTFAYLTNYKISTKNIEALVDAARRRWKVENEGHNTLKTKGYNFDRNYGHGKKNLCQVMALMKLIAMAIHVLIDYLKQETLAGVRKSYTSIKKAMEGIRNLFRIRRCKSWEELYKYALFGLDSS